ncbi:Bifunctional solanapyrone synthase [Pseudocercospora fuligena]|uniref:Bifunctional solanapyrone synthase n=1 Tax=Pseudocercospora fuligena TaxID=685502 RepID=A0A8H6VL67_9PEZI|nr:Bifunctional solanapyrone synthase [Pseudocercospora fuligena]
MLAHLTALFAVASAASFQDAGLGQQWTYDGCEKACDELSSSSSLAVHTTTNSTGFVVWDAKQQEVHSACRVTPNSSEGVSQTLAVLVKNWCRFAVKSGGHARNVDDSVSAGGVTIDLVDMKSFELAGDNCSAKIGSGHTLGSLYDIVEPLNLMYVGGRVFDVGVGGFMLGGGFSNWSPKHGLAVDNVLEYEIVLPNATVLTVNEASQPDLCFALRGGMNNFGIVTHFTIRTFPAGKILSGAVTLQSEAKDQVAEEAYKLNTQWKNDTAMTFWYSYKYNVTKDTFSLSFSQAYTEPIMDPPPFRAINNIAGANTSGLRIDSMSSFAKEVTKARPPGARNLYATVSYHPSADLDKQIREIYAEEIRSLKNVTKLSPNLIFQPVPEGAIHANKARGGSALGLEADGNLSMLLLTIGWSEATEDSAVYACAQRWASRAKAATIAAGKEHPWLYINYASQQQDPFAGYGDENFGRLKGIAKAVDPMGIFGSRGLCRGYFKLL